jgi:hypothetical protein
MKRATQGVWVMWAALVLLTLGLTGCSEDSSGDAQPTPTGCSALTACPEGQSCGVDGICRVVDTTDVRDDRPDVTPITCGGATCALGQGCCDGACVNIRTDENNCGGCGFTCSSNQTCDTAKCQPVDAVCEGRTIACGFECVDPQTDRDHCGRCGVACGVTEACSFGVCVATQTCDQPGATRCGLDCVDTQTDITHCGQCFTGCADDQVCTAGACAPVTCTAPEERCGRVCADVSSNHDNCGRCGRACGSDQYCANSQCVFFPTCADNEAFCLNVEACIDIQSDEQNCGECGNVCEAALECTGGQCLCAQGTRRCDGVCVDVQTDAAHCGRCDNACDVNTQSCTAGSCVAN